MNTQVTRQETTPSKVFETEELKDQQIAYLNSILQSRSLLGGRRKRKTQARVTLPFALPTQPLETEEVVVSWEKIYYHIIKRVMRHSDVTLLQPPMFFEQLTYLALGRKDRERIMGDLTTDHEEAVKKFGKRAANRIYAWSVIREIIDAYREKVFKFVESLLNILKMVK